jgi:hypothetical protein
MHNLLQMISATKAGQQYTTKKKSKIKNTIILQS